MAWLGNGYTVADYNGSSRTAYLDPAMIDYPPVPEPEQDKDTVVVPQVNGKLSKGDVVIVDRVVPEATV